MRGRGPGGDRRRGVVRGVFPAVYAVFQRREFTGPLLAGNIVGASEGFWCRLLC